MTVKITSISLSNELSETLKTKESCTTTSCKKINENDLDKFYKLINEIEKYLIKLKNGKEERTKKRKIV